MSIQKKSVLIGVGVSLFSAVLFIAAAWWEGRALSSHASKEAERLADTNQNQIAASLNQLVKTQDEQLIRSVESNLLTLRHVIDQKGAISFGQPEAWKAVNQFDKAESTVSLPRLQVGGEWLGKINDPKQAVSVVDEVSRLSAGPVTIFQRMNAEGDMIRVATSVVAKSGKRAIGTYIPRIQPNGQPNPVLASVLDKKRFVGSAFVVDSWYVTAYEPIVDASGKVVGMLFAGQKQESVPSLRKALEETEVGEHGKALVIVASGDDKGKVVISKGGSEDGQCFVDAVDEKGFKYGQEIFDKALKLKPGEIGEVVYMGVLDGKQDAIEARFTYYKPWNWIIVTKAYKRDFHGFVNTVSEAIKGMTQALIFVGLVAAALSVLIYSVFARRISKPIQHLVIAAENIAQGDLTPVRVTKTNDEIGALATAFEKMHDSFTSISEVAMAVGKGDLSTDFHAQSERDTLGTSIAAMLQRLRILVAELAAKARNTAQQSDQLSSASADSSRSTSEIAQTMMQVSQASEESARGTDDIAKGSSQLADNAQNARQSMGRLRKAMNEVLSVSDDQQMASSRAAEVAQSGSLAVSEAMHSIGRIEQQVEVASASVLELGAKQSEIGSILSTIGEITEQVNLLALNAAIEAARAGEAGRGFAVVADEVRRLAERASTATQEIGSLIVSVQESVDKAVSAANASASEVAEGVKHTTTAQQALDGIQEAVSLVQNTIENNNTLVNQMVKDGDIVTAAIENVAAVSSENAAAAEQLGASTEEIFASTRLVTESIGSQEEIVRRVDAMAESLRVEAEELQRLVEGFTLAETEAQSRVAA